LLALRGRGDRSSLLKWLALIVAYDEGALMAAPDRGNTAVTSWQHRSGLYGRSSPEEIANSLGVILDRRSTHFFEPQSCVEFVRVGVRGLQVHLANDALMPELFRPVEDVDIK